jgi:thiol-disulfide isomerase/thioredoxin
MRRAAHPPPRREHALLAALSLVAGLVLSACGGPSPTDEGLGYVSGDGVIEQIPVADRRVLPQITGRMLDGGDYDSRGHAGQVVVYNVWGSWCAPCREEAPVLRRVWEENRDDGVRFVGINVRDNDASARAFERRYRITYPSITTADSGRALLAFGPQLPPSAVPSTILVDSQGRVAARVIGATSYGTLSSLVEDAVGQ